MNKCLLFFLILLTSFQTQAQTQQPSAKCVVKDVYFAQPIPGALVIVNEKDSVYADDNGELQLVLKRGVSANLTVSSKGYGAKTVVVRNSPVLYTVFLEPMNYQSNFIQVRGLYNGKNLLRTPGSIGNLVTKDFLRNNQVDLQQSVNALPGVRMEFRNINTGARIILRGYGNQNNNNGIGYKAYYNAY